MPSKLLVAALGVTLALSVFGSAAAKDHRGGDGRGGARWMMSADDTQPDQGFPFTVYPWAATFLVRSMHIPWLRAGVVAGVVAAVGNGTITLSGQGDDHDRMWHGRGEGRPGQAGATFRLSPEVRVVIPGEGAHGQLAQVQVGAFVRLVVGPAGFVDMIIVSPGSASGGGSASSGAPAAVSATETASGIALGWNGVSGATSYQVLEASGGAYAPVPGAYGGTPAGAATTVTGLAAGTSYTFEVEAVTSGGASAASAPSSPVEWGARPGANASVTVTPFGGSLYATIAVPYDKALDPSSLDTATGDYTVTDTTIHALLGVAGVSASGSTLTIRTSAYPIASLQTDSLEITTAKSMVEDAAGAPTLPIDASGGQSAAAPSGVSAQETAGGIYLDWQGVAGASAYQVLASTGATYAPVSAADGGMTSGTGTPITGLAVGTSYTFEVEAVTASGTSLPSAPTGTVEWGARSGGNLATTVTEVAGDEEFTIAIPFDKPLDAASLDTSPGDYAVTDITTHQSLAVASVSLSGQMLIVQTVLGAPLALTDAIQVTTARSVVNDAVGAPTTPLDATGSL